jgi:hypothetical protein
VKDTYQRAAIGASGFKTGKIVKSLSLAAIGCKDLRALFFNDVTKGNEGFTCKGRNF